MKAELLSWRSLAAHLVVRLSCTGLLVPTSAAAQQTVVFNRARVIAFARVHAPAVATPLVRIGQSRALHVGARTLASDNHGRAERARARAVRSRWRPIPRANDSAR